ERVRGGGDAGANATAASNAAAVRILNGFTGSLRVEARAPPSNARGIPRMLGTRPFAGLTIFVSTPASVGQRCTGTRRSEAEEFLVAACRGSMTDRRQFDDDTSH